MAGRSSSVSPGTLGKNECWSAIRGTGNSLSLAVARLVSRAVLRPYNAILDSGPREIDNLLRPETLFAGSYNFLVSSRARASQTHS